MTGKHRDEPDPEVLRAQEALQEARSEKREAVRQVSFVQRLQEGWARVHERNHLAGLIDREFRRT
jgi:hypothetical protein